MTLLCISPSRVVQKLVMDWLLAKCLLCLSMKTYVCILEASKACLLAESPVAQTQVDFQQGAQLWWQGDAQLDSMPSAAAPKSAKELLAGLIWCKHGRLVHYEVLCPLIPFMAVFHERLLPVHKSATG